MTVVMMVNGRIEIVRIGGVRATEEVPLVSTPLVGALLRVGHNLKTRKTKAGRSCHAPQPSPPVWGQVMGETAFQKREPSHHTPMQGLRRPLGEKERERTLDQNPASISLDLLTKVAPVLGRKQQRSFNRESRKARRRPKHHVWEGSFTVGIVMRGWITQTQKREHPPNLIPFENGIHSDSSSKQRTVSPKI